MNTPEGGLFRVGSRNPEFFVLALALVLAQSTATFQSTHCLGFFEFVYTNL
jgi:hypothetical protein